VNGLHAYAMKPSFSSLDWYILCYKSDQKYFNIKKYLDIVNIFFSKKKHRVEIDLI